MEVPWPSEASEPLPLHQKILTHHLGSQLLLSPTLMLTLQLRFPEAIWGEQSCVQTLSTGVLPWTTQLLGTTRQKEKASLWTTTAWPSSPTHKIRPCSSLGDTEWQTHHLCHSAVLSAIQSFVNVSYELFVRQLL